MTQFLTDLLRHAFLQNALLAAVLAGVACGIVGTYVVVRRISYLAGGIAHFVLGGMGVARYMQVVHGWQWFEPLYGAVVAALLASLVIGFVSLRARQREDTIIGALWAVGMAGGILFISLTPGYSEDLMSYLFGNILMVSPGDLRLIAFLDAVIVLVVLLFYNHFFAVCFDEEFARVRGLRVEFYYLLLLGLIALTVVLLISVVGIIMVIALLTLPVAIAEHFAKRLWQMMLISALLSVAFTICGLVVSYGPGLPAGATTICIAGFAYLATVVGSLVMRSWAARREPDKQSTLSATGS